MRASRKLQGDIARVLKKVQAGVDVFDSIWNKIYDTDINANQKKKFEAELKKEIKKLQRYRDQIKTWIQSSEIKNVSESYEQALVDARKQIEREMERFKICEKETKTNLADPRDMAKSETRDWLNNVVGELESQIDSFEAELEALSVKKGKTRPPRLTHLETSITRHKAHIMKLELILRLLDNDELSAEQVDDVKDFLDDYVERNQDDFDEFSDVDELYYSLPLDKVPALEELVAVGPLSEGASVWKTSSLAALTPSMPSSAPYKDALLGARKQIEPEMERFKISEEETKTKAFSKEGLGQQPKTLQLESQLQPQTLNTPLLEELHESELQLESQPQTLNTPLLEELDESDEKPNLEVPSKKLEWIFFVINIFTELLSVAFDHLSSVNMHRYALIAMVMSCVAAIICIIELAYEAGKQKVVWRWESKLPWFYHSSPDHRPLGTALEIVGLVCAIVQTISSLVAYTLYLHHVTYSFNASLLPLVLAVGLFYSKSKHKPNPELLSKRMDNIELNDIHVKSF